MRFERDPEPVPKVRKCRCDHRPPPQVNIGIGTWRKYENRLTPKTVTTVDRTIVLSHVALRSPSAATKTQANVPGAMPKERPNTMKATGLMRMQNQAHHCGLGGRMLSSCWPSDGANAVAPIAMPIRMRMTPRAVGKKPGPMCISVPER